MTDFIVLTVIALIITAAVLYIRKAKKSGAKCIGCPDSRTCGGNCAGCTGCSCHQK